MASSANWTLLVTSPGAARRIWAWRLLRSAGANSTAVYSESAVQAASQGRSWGAPPSSSSVVGTFKSLRSAVSQLGSRRMSSMERWPMSTS